MQLHQLKNGDSLPIHALSNKNPSLVIHANTSRIKILLTSNCFDVVAILVKHLDAIVASISHQDVVIRINKDMPGFLDLSCPQIQIS